jgi:hypothetical protein
MKKMIDPVTALAILAIILAIATLTITTYYSEPIYDEFYFHRDGTVTFQPMVEKK